MVDFMAEESEQGKSEPAQASQQSVPFPVKLAREGWPLADDFGKVVVLERKEKGVLTLGFIGYSDNKKIALSSSLDKWESTFTDGLAVIREMRKETRKPKTPGPQ